MRMIIHSAHVARVTDSSAFVTVATAALFFCGLAVVQVQASASSHCDLMLVGGQIVTLDSVGTVITAWIMLMFLFRRKRARERRQSPPFSQGAEGSVSGQSFVPLRHLD